MNLRTIDKRAAGLEVEEGRRIVGYGAVFDEWTDIGPFTERLLPGVFDRVLREGNSSRRDTLGLVSHDPHQHLGRSSNGTLRLSADAIGLRYELDLPDTQPGRDARALADRGDFVGSSVYFKVISPEGERWERRNGKPARTVIDADLIDVGPTTAPAYAGTTAELRSLHPQLEQLLVVPRGGGKLWRMRELLRLAELQAGL